MSSKEKAMKDSKRNLDESKDQTSDSSKRLRTGVRADEKQIEVMCCDGVLKTSAAGKAALEKAFPNGTANLSAEFLKPILRTLIEAEEEAKEAKEALAVKEGEVHQLQKMLPKEPVLKSQAEDVVVEARMRAQRDEEIRQAFRQPYKGELHPDLVATLMDLLDKYKPDTHLSPFVAFFQSSGWGKTRFFAELSRRSESLRVVYLHIPAPAGTSNGYPKPVPLPALQQVLTAHYAHADDVVGAWSDLLLRILAFALSVAPDQLWNKFYEDRDDTGLQYSEPFIQALQEQSAADGQNSESLIQALRDQSVHDVQDRVVFVIDEAGRMGHGNAEDGGIEHWRALRRALRNVFERVPVRILGIAVATVSAGSQVHPSQQSDPSLRGTLAHMERFNPLSGLTSNLDKVGKGRPLWSQFRSAVARTQFAAEKVLCTSPLQRDVGELGLVAKCSMTLSRVPFVLPLHEAGAFVGSHMATVLNVGKTGDAIKAGYVSDPFLAQGAAFATHHASYTFNQRLEHISTLFSRSVHNNGSAGDVGELGVCMVLLETMDRVRLSTLSDRLECFSKCQSVHLDTFLRGFFKPEVDVNSFHPDLSSTMNFTHFTRVYNSESLEKATFLGKLWERQAAVICPPGYPGVDVMIPVLHKSSTSFKRVFFWLMFQAKNYNDTCSVSESEMAPREYRFVKDLEPHVSEVTCGGLYFLLNLRGKPQRSRLSVSKVDRTETDGNVSYTSRCVRVPDRSFLRVLEGCSSEWEGLMALHRHGDTIPELFTSDESIEDDMHLSAVITRAASASTEEVKLPDM